MSLLIRPWLSGFLQDWKVLPASLGFVELAVNIGENAISLMLFLLSIFIAAGEKKKVIIICFSIRGKMSIHTEGISFR